MKRILIALVALLIATTVTAQEALKREMRTVWIATVSNIDWPQSRGTGTTVINKQKKQLTDLLDGFAATNMNGVCLQVRPMADALYKSSYEPWSSYLTGTRGTDPGWDPLEFAVDECHKRGIECHVWINPYRFSNSGGSEHTTPQDQALKASGILMTVGSRVVFNPALEASRQRVVNVCKEIIENYNIDGIIFDDYFYPGDGMPSDSSAPDYQLWVDSGTKMSIGDWRRANVNLMVRNVYDMVQETRPYVKFSIGPAGVAGTKSTSASKHNVEPCPTGSDWQYNQIYSDPLAWLEEGTIDFISPQLYWKTTHATNAFEPLTKWWSYIARHFGRHHYASTNIYFMESTNTIEDWQEANAQILLTRKYADTGTSGVNFYSAKYLNGPRCTGLGQYLAQNTFTRKALTPCLDWKAKHTFGAPQNVVLNGNTLSWTPIDTLLVKYAVYAIPNSVAGDEIMSETYGGIKGDYLLNVTYSPTFTLDDTYSDGYWFAVTVVDGWGNEFEPTYINAPSGPAQAATLIAPIGGVTVQWNETFKWSAVPDARFRLQVAADEAFENIVIDHKNLTDSCEAIDLIALESLKTYYWRVITSQSGCFDAASAVATFTTPQHPMAPVTALVSPENGANIDADFALVFSKVGASGYNVQLSAESDFATIKYSSDKAVADGNNMRLDVHAALLGKGKFYWRVVTTSPGCDPSVSDVRQFTITKVPTGEYEPGYVMKQDVDTYAQVGNMQLINRWVRSVKSEYDNISFDSNGLMNRGFTARDGRIYVIGRSEGSSSANLYVDHYIADTGERLKRVSVSSAAQCSYFPANDIFQDDAGNFLISNLTLNVGSNAVNIHRLDVETGEVTLCASLYCNNTSTVRIDHCNVLGDVATGSFHVFAVMASGTQVVRWTVENGNTVDTQVMQARAYCPSSRTNFGIAPRCYPVSENQVWVKGGSVYLTLYDFLTGNIIDSFDNNSALKPKNTASNGAALFEMGGKPYRLYCSGDHGDSAGLQYTLIEGGDDTEEGRFAAYHYMWTFPAQGLGSVNSSTWDAPCCVTRGANDREKYLYVYAPGNGLAAYTLRDITPLPGDVNADGEINITDINCLINVILGNTPAATYEGRADVNGDGTTDILDANIIINLILGK